MTSCETRPIVIAIDGYSSSGKSTMAKALAKELGYRYIDSGAMYRAVTLAALDADLIDPEGQPDAARIISMLPDLEIDFRLTPDGQHTLLNGRDVEQEIRSLRVSNSVSPVAAIPEVRSALVEKQKAFGLNRGIVMDGRDIGTVVFPDAELKIFVDASPETRARRRLEEMHAKGDRSVTFEQVLDNVRRRDLIDSTRATSPLRCADDAIRFDNSDMTIAEQNQLLLNYFCKTQEALRGQAAD